MPNNNPAHSYLDPTYPAYYRDFNRPKTLLCFSLRQFILIITIYDLIFSLIALSFGLSYLIIDQLSQMNIFQSNDFIQTLANLPIGIFFDNRILSKSSWTINTFAKQFYIIIFLHIILNGSFLLCSMHMITAIKYHKPYRALIYFAFKASHFINTTAIFIGWIANNQEYFHSIRIFYGTGEIGPFTPYMNIVCLALLECLWKTFSMIMIFRSIQYIRDFCLQKESNLIKNFNDENRSSSSTQLIIHIIPNKQINV